MFDAKVYVQRRKRLKKQLGSGLALFLGHEESPMNYLSNTYHFRQNSSFLYFFGLDAPGLAGVIDVDSDRDIVFGDDVSVEDIVWMGDQPLLKDRAARVGVKHTAPAAGLEETVRKAVQSGRKVHYLPPYRPQSVLKLSHLLGFRSSAVMDYVSTDLIKAVVAQRSVKIKEEIDEMETAHALTHEMYSAAMRMTKPGIYEREIVGKMEGISLSAGCLTAFPTILTINGQILHNHDHGNVLKNGKLLVVDSGAESSLHYAADITRTYPVSGTFSPKQKDIYEIVLAAQEAAIQSIKPGIKFQSAHIKASRIIASGLKDIGLIMGDVNEAVKAGTHALFFPHGLGHMIGLDVHDMEDLGEQYVGYDEKTKRSKQFGLAYLRFARELRPGYVLTVEPGIYFIPALIDKWKKEKKLSQFINYAKVETYRDFGGIRIEDNVVVTDKGHRVLGKSIPKSVKDLEETVGKE